MDLTVEMMRGAGVPLTRENYLDVEYGGPRTEDYPEGWTAEHEADLPFFFQRTQPTARHSGVLADKAGVAEQYYPVAASAAQQAAQAEANAQQAAIDAGEQAFNEAQETEAPYVAIGGAQSLAEIKGETSGKTS